jgi:hypothetical protein
VELLGIPGDVLLQGSAFGLLLVVIAAILFGRLIPDRFLDRLLQLQNDRLAEEKARGDEWRAANQAQEQRNDVLARQITELTEIGRTTNALIEGIKQAAEKRP